MQTLSLSAIQPLSSDRTAILARVLIATLFVVSGLYKAFAFDGVVWWMSSTGVPFAPAVLVATLILEIGGGAALALGWQARRLALLFIGFTIAATVVFHPFWAVPADRFGDELTQALKNLAIIGGLILTLRCESEARPSGD